MKKSIDEIGYIEKGSGKHQSNIVYSVGGYVRVSLLDVE